MGRRGPIPMSSVLRAVRGNAGRRKITTVEPVVPSGGLPDDPPAFLSELGRQEWRRVAGECGWLTALDHSALACYCATWAHVVACEEDLKARGMTVSSVTRAGKPRAHPVQNPSLVILRSSLGLLRAFACELGLTPASRSRLRVEPPAPVSDLERFNRKHGGAAPRRTQKLQSSPPPSPGENA
jgi:P27 family predicted phage terminase small subunit